MNRLGAPYKTLGGASFSFFLFFLKTSIFKGSWFKTLVAYTLRAIALQTYSLPELHYQELGKPSNERDFLMAHIKGLEFRHIAFGKLAAGLLGVATLPLGE